MDQNIIKGKGDMRRMVQKPHVEPFSAVAHLNMRKEDKWYNGTGFLVKHKSRYFILTAAHNLVNKRDNVVASRVIAAFGRAGKERKPYGSIEKSSRDLRFPREYLTRGEGYDYGIILLSSVDRDSFEEDEYFRIDFHPDLNVWPTYMSGYPGTPETCSIGVPGCPYGSQWKVIMTEITPQRRELLYQDATTPGNSGSPVYVDYLNEYVAIGIHVQGSTQLFRYNVATRLSPEVVSEIEKLMTSSEISPSVSDVAISLYERGDERHESSTRRNTYTVGENSHVDNSDPCCSVS